MEKETSGLKKINEAAIRVIGQKGFAMATTQEIAKTAGTSEGLIFRYYKTKMDMGLLLFKKHYHDVLAMLTELGSKQDDPLVRISAVGNGFYRWFDQNKDIAQFLIKTHHEFIEMTDDHQGFTQMAGLGLKGIMGEALFLLFPSDIIAAMVVGAFLQVAVESLHGQVKGPLAPRMEPLIEALTSFLKKIGRPAED